jgi:hypothetical protein
MTKISTTNKIGIHLTIDEILSEVNERLHDEYDEEKKMLIANTIYNSVNNFYRITQAQIGEQIASYGFTYLSENIRSDDICWYSGEGMCDKYAVKNSFDESRNKGSDDPHEIINDIINGFVLACFPTNETAL